MNEKRFEVVLNEFDEVEYIMDKEMMEDRDFAEFMNFVEILAKENKQLKIANAKWLDKSLQDKQIRYNNLTCNELTKKYLQLKEENEQLKNYFKKRAECSNFQINKLKEEIAELQEDNVDTIVELSKENEQLRKKTEMDKNDFFISEAKRMRLLAFIEDKELQNEYSEWERRIYDE